MIIIDYCQVSDTIKLYLTRKFSEQSLLARK